MFENLVNYVVNVGSNLWTVSKATVRSVASLANSDKTKKIAKPLLQISVNDYLTAMFLYLINENLQETFSHQKENPEENTLIEQGFMLGVATAQVLTVVAIGRHLVRANVRTAALIKAIPAIINPPSSDRVDSNIPHPLDVSNSIMQLAGERILSSYIEALLPEHYILQQLINLWFGYEIVEHAVDEKNLQQLATRNVNSLPFLVGGGYMLASYLRELALQNSNLYLNLLIDNITFVSLFTIVANLKLDATTLKKEPYSLDYSRVVSQVVKHARPEKLTYMLVTSIKNMPSSTMTSLELMRGSAPVKLYLQLTKQMLPKIVSSPHGFFDDPVITQLIRELPREAKLNYLLQMKASSQMIETLSITGTKQQKELIKISCRFFALKEWPKAFASKIIELQDGEMESVDPRDGFQM